MLIADYYLLSTLLIPDDHYFIKRHQFNDVYLWCLAYRQSLILRHCYALYPSFSLSLSFCFLPRLQGFLIEAFPSLPLPFLRVSIKFLVATGSRSEQPKMRLRKKSWRRKRRARERQDEDRTFNWFPHIQSFLCIQISLLFVYASIARSQPSRHDRVSPFGFSRCLRALLTLANKQMSRVGTPLWWCRIWTFRTITWMRPFSHFIYSRYLKRKNLILL